MWGYFCHTNKKVWLIQWWSLCSISFMFPAIWNTLDFGIQLEFLIHHSFLKQRQNMDSLVSFKDFPFLGVSSYSNRQKVKKSLRRKEYDLSIRITMWFLWCWWVVVTFWENLPGFMSIILTCFPAYSQFLFIQNMQAWT
jgi:hypothetical protein